MTLSTHQKTILGAFLVALVAFIATFLAQGNYEFLGYVGIVLVLLVVLIASLPHVQYPDYVLWGLFAWAVLHMLGGVQMANGKVVYTLMLYRVVGEPYSILKYDQPVHAFGFFVGTLVMYYVLKRYLVSPFRWGAVGFVAAMAGLGLGALNEIVEFMMTVVLPNTNVGGYENTAIDLCSNLVGAVLAVLYLRYRESKLAKAA